MRHRIGIIFNSNKNWLGGVYYIINIIKSLDYLDDSKKPELIVFYTKELKSFIDEIDYPYLKKVEFHFTPLLKGYLFSWIKRRNLFAEELINDYKLDVIFPLKDYPARSGPYPKLITWRADFQHKFYPEYFSKKTLIGREVRFKFALRNATDLVLSSHDAVNNFHQFYKRRKRLNVHVLQFVSIVDDFNFQDLEYLKMKYQVPVKYFMISNQFHKHKNHIVLLKALSLLNDGGNNFHFVITGKVNNPGNEKYVETIRSLIDKYNLHNDISLLGVIPRLDQLSLMKHSQAVIQPSLFEGWSTVIEDAKSLQVPVIASNIPVHREQLGSAGYFFEPEDEKQLADLLQTFTPPPEQIFHPYEKRVKDFALHFMDIVHN